MFSMVLKTDEPKCHVRFDEYILLWQQGAIKEHLVKSYYVSDTMLNISVSHLIMSSPSHCNIKANITYVL